MSKRKIEFTQRVKTDEKYTITKNSHPYKEFIQDNSQEDARMSCAALSNMCLGGFHSK